MSACAYGVRASEREARTRAHNVNVVRAHTGLHTHMAATSAAVHKPQCSAEEDKSRSLSNAAAKSAALYKVA